jgi:hypothetical protein
VMPLTPQVQAPAQQPAPPAVTSSSNAAVPPLSPPVEVKPVPSPPMRPPPQKQRQPLVITPNGTP